jgi:F0F1-type ATP synthase membrane subunit c/vacuolar-type H+-ATPase subunit K
MTAQGEMTMTDIQSGATYRAFISLAAGLILCLGLTSTGIGQGATRRTGHPGTIGAGTTIKVRTNEAIKTSSEGQRFSGVVDQDVIGSNGKVVVPRGSNAALVVKRLSNKDVVLDLDSVTINGQRYGVQTESVISSKEKQGIGANKRTGKFVGGGAVVGGIIGAIAGGGKGAAIGAGVGAGAGAGAQILTKGRSLNVPAESLLTYRMKQPLRAGAAAR